MAIRTKQVSDELAAKFFEAQPGDVVVVMGKCPEKGCKHGVRLELPGIYTFAPDSPHAAFGFKTTPPRGFALPEGYGWIGGAAYLSGFAGKDHRCPEHQYGYHFKGLRTVLTETICDPACTHATGDECHCSCNGANHGVLA